MVSINWLRILAYQFGKLITPTWGVRAQFNGVTQHLCLDNSYWEHNKTYFGGNIDAMINLSTLFAGVNPNRFFEVYGFLGPQVTVAKSANVLIQNDGTMIPDGDEKARARVGASAGLGLKFNINTKWAIDVEARGAIAPSIFGNISSHRKAEGTGMLTAGVSYIFGGKKFVKASNIDEMLSMRKSTDIEANWLRLRLTWLTARMHWPTLNLKLRK